LRSVHASEPLLLYVEGQLDVSIGVREWKDPLTSVIYCSLVQIFAHDNDPPTYTRPPSSRFNIVSPKFEATTREDHMLGLRDERKLLTLGERIMLMRKI
jgi:hypothetical protein